MPVFQNKGVNLLRIFTLNVNPRYYRECICKFGCDKGVISQGKILRLGRGEYSAHSLYLAPKLETVSDTPGSSHKHIIYPSDVT